MLFRMRVKTITERSQLDLEELVSELWTELVIIILVH